jgi:hypothetical protein
MITPQININGSMTIAQLRNAGYNVHIEED